MQKKNTTPKEEKKKKKQKKTELQNQFITNRQWKKRENRVCVYIYRNENPSTKSTRRVEANLNTLKENQNNQNSTNEVENLMLKGHHLPQIS
jgi:hypothetical protein